MENRLCNFCNKNTKPDLEGDCSVCGYSYPNHRMSLPEKSEIIPPKNGWEENCYYLIDVAYHKNNVVHRALFFSGFLDSNNNPSGYNHITNHSYIDEKQTIKDAYYLKVIKKILDSSEI